MTRTVSVKLQAEVGSFVRGMREGGRATGQLSESLDTATDKATRMSTTLDRAAGSAADDFDEVARHARRLDDQIEQTERGIRSLAKGFAQTGDPKILAAIRQQQVVARELTNVRSLLPKAADLRKGGSEMAGHVGTGFLTSLRTTLPMAANPAMLAAGTAAAPVFISAFSSALSAGAGVGVLGVGLRALAEDPVVKLRGGQVGKNFSEGLQREAREAFQGPVLQSLDRLDAAGQRMTARLGKAFDALADDIDPFTAKVIGAGEAVTGSFVSAAEKSGPALDGLGDSVTLLGEGAAYFIDTVSDGGPQAADNLRLIAGATADVAKYSANVLDVANKLANNAWITGPLLPALRSHYRKAADEATRLKEEQSKIPPELDLTTAAARGQRDALSALSKELKSQTDPAFALLDAQQKLKKAQDDAAAAVKKHGRNSAEAKDATRNLALAALDLQGKAGALGASFNGTLSPAMLATYRAAGLTENQISDVEREFVAAKRAGDKFDGAFRAQVSITGHKGVMTQLDKLLVQQLALNRGITVSAAGSAYRKNAYGFAEGGWTGPGSKYEEAGIVHRDEFVVRKDSRRQIERQAPGFLDELNETGRLPGYAGGGRVWPYPVNAANAYVMSKAEALSRVTPAVPSGGRTSDWIVATVKSRFPGVRVLSKDRPGARTLSGNVSYHARGRAVDFEPSKDLARWWDAYYRARTKELISPYQQYNIHNGQRHRYTGAVWRQHNFAGGNAHDHIAMGNGGVIREHVVGVGASGRTYEFGENGRPETVTPGYPAAPTWVTSGAGGGGATVNNNVNVTVTAPVGSHPVEIGNQILKVVGAALSAGSELRVRGQKVF